MDDCAESACFSPRDSYLTAGLLALAMTFPTIALARKPRKLTLWLFGWVLNLTAFRFLTCMNCMFYGKDCAGFGWGLLTAKLFKRDRGPDDEAFRSGFPVALAFLELLFFYPLPEMWKRKKLLAAYFVAMQVMFFVHLSGCKRCENKACPMGERARNLPL